MNIKIVSRKCSDIPMVASYIGPMDVSRYYMCLQCLNIINVKIASLYINEYDIKIQ